MENGAVWADNAAFSNEQHPQYISSYQQCATLWCTANMHIVTVCAINMLDCGKVGWTSRSVEAKIKMVVIKVR